MELILNEDLFVNDKYVVSYGGNKQAMFTIVDETFEGNNGLGRINRIIVLVREIAPQGDPGDGVFCSTVIGMGDGVVGVRTDEPELRGKLLSRDNMSRCVVELKE
jgi:hypothetical protein